MAQKNNFVLDLFEKYCNFIKFIKKEAPEAIYVLGKLGNFNFFELSATETFEYFRGFIENLITIDDIRTLLLAVMQNWDPDHPETRPIDKAVQHFFSFALSYATRHVDSQPITEEFTQEKKTQAIQILIPALQYFQDNPDPNFSFRTMQYLHYFCEMMIAFKLSIKEIPPQ